MTARICAFGLLAFVASIAVAQDMGEHIRYRAGKLVVDISGWDYTRNGAHPISKLENDDLGCASDALKTVKSALEQTPEFHKYAKRAGFAIQIDVSRYWAAGAAVDETDLQIDENHIYMKAPRNLGDFACMVQPEYASTIGERMRNYIQMKNAAAIARRERKKYLNALGDALLEASRVLGEDRAPAKIR